MLPNIARSFRQRRSVSLYNIHKRLVTTIKKADMLTSEDYRRLILESKVYDIAVETPLQPAPALSALVNNQVLFKREDMQPVFSFKIRGAYNKIASLTDEEKNRGVVCCSAGNHAQGVALSAKVLGIKAKIVMPLATPEIKVKSVKYHAGDYGTIVLHGANFDEAAAEAKRIEKEENMTLILPFDDPYVIAGQATVGMEILQQTTGKHLDAIFVASGGGGLLAGISTWVKQIRPSVKVIGVEAADAPGMTDSLINGERVQLDHVGLFADGAAVKLIGDETFRLCRENVDEMITVTTDEICAAIKAGFNDTRVILEPAGALAIAGANQYALKSGMSGSTFAVVVSGANIDFARLRFISERADYSETLLSVKIDETPGSFKKLFQQFDSENVRITEFSYRYSDKKMALIFMSFQSSTREKAKHMLSKLTNSGYDAMDLTDNELAKVHTRHMAGGKSQTVQNELLYRFEFPDRPTALRKFLYQLDAGWNISLFHYRNHGDDVGRVLVGFQVSEGDKTSFESFLTRLGYTHHDETSNPIYKQFLL